MTTNSWKEIAEDCYKQLEAAHELIEILANRNATLLKLAKEGQELARKAIKWNQMTY